MAAAKRTLRRIRLPGEVSTASRRLPSLLFFTEATSNVTGGVAVWAKAVALYRAEIRHWRESLESPCRNDGRRSFGLARVSLDYLGDTRKSSKYVTESETVQRPTLPGPVKVLS